MDTEREEYEEEYSLWEEEELNGYRPLDFDDNSVYDRRHAPSLEEELNNVLDEIEAKEKEAALLRTEIAGEDEADE